MFKPFKRMDKKVLLNNKRMKRIKEDRLSSFPDSILVDIISFLPLKMAASTSILSRRWRHLWTHITRLNLTLLNNPEPIINTQEVISSPNVPNILGQLTSPKFHSLQMSMDFYDGMDSVESCLDILDFVIGRNAEEIKVHAIYSPNFCSCRPIKAFPFSSPSLIALELDEFCSFEDFGSFSLPNLKTLKLRTGGDDAQGIGILIKSCPLLEVLKLVYQYDYDYDTGDAVVIDISCPNLKFLDIRNYTDDQQKKTMINAPNLLYLKIDDFLVHYHFVVTPTRLVEAFILLQDKEEFRVGDTMVSNIFPASCNVTYLEISGITMLGYLKSMQDNGAMPIFHNLLELVIIRDESQTFFWEYLLLLLKWFPNLEKLEVDGIDEDDIPMPLDCNLLDTLPAHVLSKVLRVKISGIAWSYDYMKMLRFILSKATVLEQLVVQFDQYYLRTIPNQDELWKEYEFSEALFKLPKTSSMCEIVFSGSYIRNASSNALKNGEMDCRIRYIR